MVISQKKAVKKKFMAATSMLLIACIMLISASYAWFTLSTAPEVKGITTTVGANGNLEIALATDATWANNGSTIVSNVGDSSEKTGDVTASNITWGNIVDLGNAAYGLSDVSLLPSALNVTGTTVSEGSPLLIPSYGADGRVASLEELTQAAKYDTSNQAFVVSTADAGATPDAVKGRVQAVGSALDLTARQIAYRNAKSDINVAKKAAQTEASSSIKTYGAALADIIIKHATGGAKEVYTQTDVDALAGMVTHLETAVDSVSDAIDAAVLGYAASKKGEDAGITDTQYNALKSLFTDTSVPYSVDENGTLTLTVEEQTYTIAGLTDLAARVAAVEEMETDVATAKAAVGLPASDSNTATGLYAQLAGDGISWSEISGAMSSLVEPSMVTVCGLPTAGLLDDADRFFKAYQKNGLIVAMPTGSGLFSDIADFCGDYSAGIVIPEVTYGTMTLTDVDATMRTESTVEPEYLAVVASAVETAGSPSSSTSTGTVSLTDYYGYKIDLFFRTNATVSNLLLQTEAVQRIYTDSTEETTLGGGSCMTFTATDGSGLTEQNVKDLMSAIRVVLMDSKGEIYSYAKLDTDNATTDSSGAVKAYLRLCDKDGNLSGKTLTDATGATTGFEYDNVITELEANTPLALSALVYLDGNVVTNSMVAANAATSVTGTLNLQFASDADLVPMENTALKGQTTTTETDTEGTQTVEVENIESTDPNAAN